ncbi:MAG: hypothetical protein GY953_36960 [bacterium]|nr:hypothetical protein [bacterium]
MRGRELRYLKEVPDGGHISTPLEGFGASRDHNRFEIENTRVKAGVRMATDKPLVRLFYWSPRTTLCPEPFISLAIDPGQSDTWTTRYEFYTTE